MEVGLGDDLCSLRILAYHYFIQTNNDVVDCKTAGNGRLQFGEKSCLSIHFSEPNLHAPDLARPLLVECFGLKAVKWHESLVFFRRVLERDVSYVDIILCGDEVNDEAFS